MLAATALAIFFLPVTYYVIERLSGRRKATAELPIATAAAAPAR